MPDFDRSLFWPAFEAAGFLTTATVTTGGTTADYQVDFEQPDETLFPSNSRSRQYAIRYPFALLPTLAQGDVILIDGIAYRVRETPNVPFDQGRSGYWRHALLTDV